MKKYLTRDEIHQMLKEDKEHLKDKVKELRKANRRLERINKRKHLRSFYFGEEI